jgi:hypothetical protein
VKQDFKTIDVLRLEVETAPAGLPNLVPNPSGEKGAWFWVTPVANTVMSSTGTALTFTTTVSQACYGTSIFMPVAATKYVAARFDLVSITASHNIKVRYDWYDASKIFLSSSTQSGALSTIGPDYALTVQAPASTAYLKVRVDLYNGAGNPSAGAAVTFKQAMVTWQNTNSFTTVRTNRVRNPSFETNTTGWTGANATIARTTAQAAVGTASLSVTCTDGGAGFAAFYSPDGTPGMPVSGSLDYTVQYKSRAASTARDTFLRVRWFTSAGTFISDHDTANLTNATSGWVQNTGTFTAPSNAAFLALELDVVSPNTSEVHYFDALLVETGYAVLPYFDGSTTDTGSIDYAWTGTAHASTSTSTSTAFAYAEPYQWLNILGPAHEIAIDRHTLDVGTFSATVLDALLDPAVASEIAPGKLVRLRVSTDAGATYSSLYEGRINNAQVSYTRDEDSAAVPMVVRTRITLTATDNITLLANQAEARGIDTIATLPFILEDKGVPWSVNGSGNQVTNAVLVAYNESASVLDQVAITRDSVSGYAWVDKTNVLTANDAAEMPSGVVATFSDVTGVSYSDIEAGFNTDACINQVTVTWLRFNASTLETTEIVYGPYKDQASIDLYGAHAKTFTIQGFTGTGGESAPDIAAFAAAILTANKTPIRRASRVTVPIKNAAGLVVASALDLYDLAHVDFSTIIDADYRATGISHAITPELWTMSVEFEQDGSVASPQVTPSPTPNNGVIDGTWIAPTLTNSWVDYGAPWTTAGYRRDGNRVTLKGLIKNGTVGSSVFTLPVGYRPGADMHVPAHSSSTTTGAASAGTAHTHPVTDKGGLNVYANGQVTPRTGSSNTNFSVDGISFIAEA